MRRGVAAAVCALALIAAGGCSNDDDAGNGDETTVESDNGDDVTGESDNGDGTAPGPGGDADGGHQATVPTRLTTAEFCEIFEDEILQPAAAILQDAVEQIEAGAVTSDEAMVEAGKADFLAGIDNLVDVFQQTAGALTDNPDLADALLAYVEGTDDFATAMIDAISEPGWHPHTSEMPPPLVDATETLDVAADRVDSHCS